MPVSGDRPPDGRHDRPCVSGVGNNESLTSSSFRFSGIPGLAWPSPHDGPVISASARMPGAKDLVRRRRPSEGYPVWWPTRPPSDKIVRWRSNRPRRQFSDHRKIGRGRWVTVSVQANTVMKSILGRRRLERTREIPSLRSCGRSPGRSQRRLLPPNCSPCPLQTPRGQPTSSRIRQAVS